MDQSNISLGRALALKILEKGQLRIHKVVLGQLQSDKPVVEFILR
jgi:hypothetical protein